MVTTKQKDAARKALVQAYIDGDMDAAGRATAVLRAWLLTHAPTERKVIRRFKRKPGPHAPAD